MVAIAARLHLRKGLLLAPALHRKAIGRADNARAVRAMQTMDQTRLLRLASHDDKCLSQSLFWNFTSQRRQLDVVDMQAGLQLRRPVRERIAEANDGVEALGLQLAEALGRRLSGTVDAIVDAVKIRDPRQGHGGPPRFGTAFRRQAVSAPRGKRQQRKAQHAQQQPWSPPPVMHFIIMHFLHKNFHFQRDKTPLPRLPQAGF